MLDLLKFYSPSSVSCLRHLVLSQETFLFYVSADSVLILNARSLALRRVLAFWEAFPGLLHSKGTISCLSVDSGMGLVIAAMGSRIAAWSLSGTQNAVWRVHSSLTLPSSHVVTALDSRSGLLAVGSQDTLSVYTLILEDDLPTWSKKWFFDVVSPSHIRFSPSLMYIATTSKNDNAVRVYNTTSGRITQVISHPRPVIDIMWRAPQASTRDDLMLYTITSDSTLRIFLPVLDQPHRLQLHGSLDRFSTIPLSVSTQLSFDPTSSSIFRLNRKVVRDVFVHVLDQEETDQEVARRRRIREIMEEGWDLFLRVLEDGALIVSAVANIDRRPPTLLKNITLVHSTPGLLSLQPSYLYMLPTPEKDGFTLVTSPPLSTFELSPLPFFDAHPDGLTACVRGSASAPGEESSISRFVRTPDGNSVGVIRESGGDIWTVRQRGSQLSKTGSWTEADLVVVLETGKYFASYAKATSVLTLHTSPAIPFPIPKVTSLFSVPFAKKTSILGIADDYSIIQVHVTFGPVPSLSLDFVTQLPLSPPPILIIPVDPMAWSGPYKSTPTEHDVLLSVSDDGGLAFWIPDDGLPARWRCTGRVRTGRRGLRKARCSSAKKSVLVVPTLEGEELTIWDSKESEFASGLEYRGLFSFSEPVNDLDWTATPDSRSILAVGFSHRVELLCQRRMTYFDDGVGWEICWKVDIESIVPYHISDSIWLAHGSLLIGAGQHMFLFGQPKQPNERESPYSLFEHVARHNGPLDDFHPQMLLQCLLWDKVELVKDIIVLLSRHLELEKDFNHWVGMPVDRFLKSEAANIGVQRPVQHRQHYTSLFAEQGVEDGIEEQGFSRTLVEKLIDRLETQPLPHLTPNEHAHLLVLIQTTLEIEEQRRALDPNGLRYLISMRSFYILNSRSSPPATPGSQESTVRKIGWRRRLRYRDMIWAFHSESQDLLLSSSVTAGGGKMRWSDARALGVFLWLKSTESIKSHLEVIARNEYMTEDRRDPTDCSLYYFALGKVKLVHGLWRQAAWHKEQAVMLKFLSNDFSQARWRTAALKNAYALLSKQRFEYAAAFFLLGGSLKDAVNVCLNKLSDVQLAIALTRVMEGDDEGPILQSILRTTVVPLAFKDGNRWLASWAFWLLHRRDLAVRVLVTPLQDISAVIDISITEIGDPHYDDPSLALLFSQLKMKTLQTAKGTSEISGRTEFNFVLQIARVFCRMGCHVLALDLVRSWSFARPATVPLSPSVASVDLVPPRSPIFSRRSHFGVDQAIRRQSSILIDMEVSSGPPTRHPSPERLSVKLPMDHPEETIKEEGDLFARKAGMGNLIKSAKQDVQVPEFDLNAFF